MSIELGTSRSASRSAADTSNAHGPTNERVVDTTTGKVFDAAAAVALVGGLAASGAIPDASLRHRRFSFFAGIFALLGSCFLSATARRHLGRFHRDSLTVHADHELVDTGSYQRVRHPLYTATIGVVVGIGAVLGNKISLALAVLPTLALLRRIQVEEEMLADALGPSYLEYCRRTERWIPGVW